MWACGFGRWSQSSLPREWQLDLERLFDWCSHWVWVRGFAALRSFQVAALPSPPLPLHPIASFTNFINSAYDSTTLKCATFAFTLSNAKECSAFQTYQPFVIAPLASRAA